MAADLRPRVHSGCRLVTYRQSQKIELRRLSAEALTNHPANYPPLRRYWMHFHPPNGIPCSHPQKIRPLKLVSPHEASLRASCPRAPHLFLSRQPLQPPKSRQHLRASHSVSHDIWIASIISVMNLPLATKHRRRFRRLIQRSRSSRHRQNATAFSKSSDCVKGSFSSETRGCPSNSRLIHVFD